MTADGDQTVEGLVSGLGTANRDFLVIGTAINGKLKREGVFDALLVGDLVGVGRHAFLVARQGLPFKFLSVCEVIPIRIDVGNVRAGNVEIVLVKPAVFDRRANRFRCWIQHIHEFTVNRLQDGKGGKQADINVLELRRGHFGLGGEQGPGGFKSAAGGVGAKVILFDHVRSRLKIGALEAQHIGHEQAPHQQGNNAEDAQQQAVVFGFDPLHRKMSGL